MSCSIVACLAVGGCTKRLPFGFGWTPLGFTGALTAAAALSDIYNLFRYIIIV
jgi:hypothetical protein